MLLFDGFRPEKGYELMIRFLAGPGACLRIHSRRTSTARRTLTPALSRGERGVDGRLAAGFFCAATLAHKFADTLLSLHCVPALRRARLGPRQRHAPHVSRLRPELCRRLALGRGPGAVIGNTMPRQTTSTLHGMASWIGSLMYRRSDDNALIRK